MELIKKMGPRAILLSFPFFVGGFYYRPLFIIVAFLWYAALVSYLAFRFVSSRNMRQPAPTPVKKVKVTSPKSDKVGKLLVAAGKHLVQFLAFIGNNLAQVLSFVWKHAKVLLAELFVWVWQNKVLSWLIGSGMTLFVAITTSSFGLTCASSLSLAAAVITVAKQWKQTGKLVWKVVTKFPILTMMVFFFVVGVIGFEFKNETNAFIGIGISSLLFFGGLMYLLKKPTDIAHEAIEKKFFSKKV